jgi:hypothetical protein
LLALRERRMKVNLNTYPFFDWYKTFLGEFKYSNNSTSYLLSNWNYIWVYLT